MRAGRYPDDHPLEQLAREQQRRRKHRMPAAQLIAEAERAKTQATQATRRKQTPKRWT